MFYFFVFSMMIISGLFVVAPLIFRPSAGIERQDINILVFQERLKEIEDEDPNNASQLKSELKRELLANTAIEDLPLTEISSGKTSLVVLSILLPLISAFIYFDVGFGQGSIPDVHLAKKLANSDSSDLPSYRLFIQEVEKRAETKPDDQDLKFLLARGYSELGNYDKAVLKYRELLISFPRDPGLLSNYAGALFVANNREMTEPVLRAVDKALSVNPKDVAMMEIKAIASMADKDKASALAWFQKALDTGLVGQRAELIKGAMRRLAETGDTETGLYEKEDDGLREEEKPGRQLRIQVDLAKGVPRSVGARVYVYAKAANGPPMPLAVRQINPELLPKTIVLDDSMAMVDGMGLSNFDEVVVIARLSQSGLVTREIGDYEAVSRIVDLNKDRGIIELNLKNAVSE